VFFNMFDANHDGEISFFEFVSGCSVLLKGDLETKARSSSRLFHLRMCPY
jgi:Ca2+-binding EF-hand superfamily protein